MAPGTIHHRTLVARGNLHLVGIPAKVAGSGTPGMGNGCGINYILWDVKVANLHLLSFLLRHAVAYVHFCIAF